MKPFHTLFILGLLASVASTQPVSDKPVQNKPAEEKTKLLEPYAPKPSGQAPDGWDIRPLAGSSIESVTQLQNGKEIKVNAVAYQLVPKEGAVILTDPGFDPKLANSQKNTIGALLTEYSEVAGQLQENLEKTLGQLDAALGAPTPSVTKPEEKKSDEKKPEEKKSDEKKPTVKKPR